MKMIELDRYKLLNMLFCKEPCGYGGYGVLVARKDKVYKIYYKTLINTYMSGNETYLDQEVDVNLMVDKEFGLKDPYKRLKDFERLEKTKSKGLITGVLSYKGLYVGIEMNYLRDYVSFWDALDSISHDELSEYLNKTLLLINDLLDHDIVPRDIRGENVLINPITKNLALIDLDDLETIYGTTNYVKDYPHNKDIVMQSFNELRTGLLESKKRILTRSRML